MIYIQHRVNTIAQLQALQDKSLGCEIDLRSKLGSPDSLYLAHDPFAGGDDFEEWLGVFASKNLQGPLILNTKEDGLESSVVKLLNKKNIQNYFFLDTALPTLVKSAGPEFKKFAVRYSAFEPKEFVMKFSGKVEWMWVDCFNNEFPPYFPEAKLFKICLVSPELHGFDKAGNKNMDQWLPHATAICSKLTHSARK